MSEFPCHVDSYYDNNEKCIMCKITKKSSLALYRVLQKYIVAKIMLEEAGIQQTLEEGHSKRERDKPTLPLCRNLNWSSLTSTNFHSSHPEKGPS